MAERFCTSCGAVLSDDTKFCTECGVPIGGEGAVQAPQATPVQAVPQSNPVQAAPQPTTVQPIPQAAPPQAPIYVAPQAPVYTAQPASGYAAEYVPGSDSKYQPISTWGYIGITLLICIPIVGFVLLIIWALGGCRKINKRNLARASLIGMAIGLVFSLIAGFLIKKAFKDAMEASGLSSIMEQSGLEGSGGLGDLLGGVLSQDEDSEINYEDLFGGSSNESSGSSYNSGSTGGDDMSSMMDALSILGALSGSSSGSSANSEMSDLTQAMSILGALTGNGSSGDSDLSALLQGVESANKQAEAASDGWPKDLRPYPGGTETAVESYRTEFSGTTIEEMKSYIEDLKKDGFKFEDFYEFGFSEADMLAMNGWWGTNGELYLSISFEDGVVTIDHMTELPALEDLFG